MLPGHMYFEGLEEIPGLEGIPNNNSPAHLKVTGNCPIIISAPHSGTEGTTPNNAKSFGLRQSGNTSDDTNTLKITFALIRTLSAMGAVPNAAINLVSRRYMDLNRTWNGQGTWQDNNGNIFAPGNDNRPVSQFPRVAEFQNFRDAYYQAFHNTLLNFTTAYNPNGWLFDVHGKSFQGGNLIVFSGYGYYARQDFVYQTNTSLYQSLVDQGFQIRELSGAINEVGNGGTVNLISGGRYGASFFNPPNDPVPFPGNVVPNQPRRVHGIQFEIEQSLRFNRSDEELESVGINLAYGIYNAMLGNGVIQHIRNPLSGEFANEWFQTVT